MRIAKSIGKMVDKFIDSKVSTILVILVFAFPFIVIFLATLETERINYSRSDKNILDGYYDSFTYELGITDYYRYEIYYYESDYDYKFINSKNYSLIDENNIVETKKLFEIMKRIINNEPCKEKFDKFDLNIITLGDYVLIERSKEYYEEVESGCKEKEYCSHEYNFTVYFYDIDTHILYYIENFE